MTAGFPSWRDWLFSAKAFAASMLALYVALAAGLPRPYWAMAAVYVVANPLSGATRSKALYRALGTFVGAAGAVFLVPLLVDAPELLSLAVAVWTGGFLFVSLLDRTPRSYLFMLAGYSLPLISLPTVNVPETIFDVALARSIEITIGIVCASLVASIVFPTAVGPTFGAQVARWKNDAAGWIADILKRGDAGAVGRERLRLASDMRALELLIGQLAYDTAARDTVRRARDLQARLGMILPILSSLGDRAGAMRAAGAEPAGFREIRSDVLEWVENPSNAGEAGADDLQRRVAALEPQGEDALRWGGLLVSGALARMRDLVDLWQDIRLLQDRILAGDRASGRMAALRFRNTFRPARHYDFGLLAFSAMSVVAATLLASLVWIWSGWAEGSGCVIMTAVGASFFAASDDPGPQIKSFVVWMAVATAVSAIYLFAILPAVHSFEMVAAAFALPFLVFGTLVSRPQYTMIAMLMSVNVASLVGIQETYSGDFASFVNNNLASIGGGLFGLAWTMATRPFGAALAARRLVRAGWRDIAAIAGGTGERADRRFAGRMLDRAGQLAPRLALADDPHTRSADTLAELRLGLNLVELKRLRPRLPGDVEARAASLLATLARHFGAQAATGRRLPLPDDLRASIDEAIAGLAGAGAAGETRRDGLHALVGLRRALFPDAPPPARLPVDADPMPYAIAAE